MAYSITATTTVEEALHDVALRQVGKALEALDRAGDGVPADAVKECRTRCKKLRGLLRLVRPALGPDYQEANRTFRDAARELRPLRDTQALLTTFDHVIAADPAQLPSGGLGGVREGLRRRVEEAVATANGPDGPLDRARHLLEVGQDAIDGWSLSDDGWDAVGPGVAKTYRRGRKALHHATDHPSPEAFHEWRKRAKYTWHHVRLLEDTAPSVLAPLAKRLHGLTDALGDAHDLGELERILGEDPDWFGGVETVDGALVVLAGRRTELEAAACSLGSRLYAEKPDAFAERLGRYWKVWEDQGEERRAAATASLHPPTDGLEQLTVERLSEMASDAEVPGRSGMRKADLVGAVRARR